MQEDPYLFLLANAVVLDGDNITCTSCMQTNRFDPVSKICAGCGSARNCCASTATLEPGTDLGTHAVATENRCGMGIQFLGFVSRQPDGWIFVEGAEYGIDRQVAQMYCDMIQEE